jgi:hypothetical protein
MPETRPEMASSAIEVPKTDEPQGEKARTKGQRKAVNPNLEGDIASKTSPPGQIGRLLGVGG